MKECRYKKIVCSDGMCEQEYPNCNATKSVCPIKEKYEDILIDVRMVEAEIRREMGEHE